MLAARVPTTDPSMHRRHAREGGEIPVADKKTDSRESQCLRIQWLRIQNEERNRAQAGGGLCAELFACSDSASEVWNLVCFLAEHYCPITTKSLLPNHYQKS